MLQLFSCLLLAAPVWPHQQPLTARATVLFRGAPGSNAGNGPRGADGIPPACGVNALLATTQSGQTSLSCAASGQPLMSVYGTPAGVTTGTSTVPAPASRAATLYATSAHAATAAVWAESQ